MTITIDHIRYKMPLPPRFNKDPEASKIANWVSSRLPKAEAVVISYKSGTFLFFNVEYINADNMPIFVESLDRDIRKVFNF